MTVDYEGVWAPGVVAEYGEMEEQKVVFQPKMFDYEHGGEEGCRMGKVTKEEISETCIDYKRKDEEEDKNANKRYSRKRLVGFF